MAWSREVGNAFLDYRIVVLSQPADASKVAAGWSKFVLRRAIEDKLPPVSLAEGQTRISTPRRACSVAKCLAGDGSAVTASHMSKGG